MQVPSPTEMEAGLRRLTERLVAWGAIRVVVFGSVARGDYLTASDIDLIVVFGKEREATWSGTADAS